MNFWDILAGLPLWYRMIFIAVFPFGVLWTINKVLNREVKIKDVLTISESKGDLLKTKAKLNRRATDRIPVTEVKKRG